MRAILLASCLLLFSPDGVCQYKTLEKSGARPGWVNGSETNYIITFGSGNTVEEAKDECLKNIRETIINAVAIQVRSKTDINITQVNGKTDEQFKHSITSQSAKIPYLQGISLSKATGYYWEKVLDKRDKSIKYGYHIKYPFSDGQLRQLIEEFDTRDQEITRQIGILARACDTISYLEKFPLLRQQLLSLQEELIDDRKDKIKVILSDLSIRLKSIEMVTYKNNPGEYEFYLRKNMKRLKTNLIPGFSSNCGKFKSGQQKDSTILITYDGNLCKYTNQPKAALQFDLGEMKLDKEFAIDMTANKVELLINEDIKLDKQDNNISIDLALFSKYAYPFEIKKIEIVYENQPPLVASGLSVRIDKKGLHKISAKADKIPKELQKYSSADKAFPYCNLIITYLNINTGENNSINLSNTKFVTDW